jgi:hypothetical protein
MDVNWYVPAHGLVDDARTMKEELPIIRRAVETIITEEAFARRWHTGGASHDAGQVRRVRQLVDTRNVWPGGNSPRLCRVGELR